jgi:hypothetical protein
MGAPGDTRSCRNLIYYLLDYKLVVNLRDIQFDKGKCNGISVLEQYRITMKKSEI